MDYFFPFNAKDPPDEQSSRDSCWQLIISYLHEHMGNKYHNESKGGGVYRPFGCK